MKITKRLLATLLAGAITITSVGFLSSFSDNSGKNGIVPVIGENGNWWIGDTDTGVSAIGEKGDTGDTGAKGEKGETGDTGAKGEKGETGDAGAKGEQGDKGDAGEKGEVGDTGAKGENGDTGAKGEKGDKGDKGETGDKGAKGEKGDEGDKGKPGREGVSGENAVAPEYRYNQMTQKLEITNDGGKTWTAVADLPLATNGFSYPVDSIEHLPGTIAYELDGKYIVPEDEFWGAVIDVEGTVFNSVKLTKNASGNALCYAFLTDELRVKELPSYAEGYNEVVVDEAASVVLSIPADAKYLYVYYTSPDEPHLPSSITFYKEKITAPDSPLKDDTLTEYDFPIDKLTLLSGTVTDNVNNKNYNTFVKNSEYYGALIKVENTVFDTVTIKRNANGNCIGYAFLADSLVYDRTPAYATGYTKILWPEEDVTVRIPENAKYLYVYYTSPNNPYVPSSIKFTKSGETAKDNGSVRLATWNIGHFSFGDKSDSTITSEKFVAQSKLYSNYINNCIGADVIALNEYSKYFIKNNTQYLTSDSIFSEYENFYEGKQLNYSCNAVYSKLDLPNVEVHEFECNKNVNLSNPYIEASDYYYITADVTVNGETVKLVMAHLAFCSGSEMVDGLDMVNINQILELIEYCQDYERVVLMGDWNVDSFDYFKYFTDEGYSLANEDGTLPTYHKDKSASSLDNIIYKGVSVSNFTLVGTDLSDHYAIYCDITVDKQ